MTFPHHSFLPLDLFLGDAVFNSFFSLWDCLSQSSPKLSSLTPDNPILQPIFCRVKVRNYSHCFVWEFCGESFLGGATVGDIHGVRVWRIGFWRRFLML